MMKTPENIMKKLANEHSYETWSELMYDCHDTMQVEYTKDVMVLFAKQSFYAAREAWENYEMFENKFDSFDEWYDYIVKNDKNDKK